MTDKYNEEFSEKTFNQQMAEICAEVERIIRSGEKQAIKANGRENYENTTVAKLFELTRSDPKNLGLMREILRAEKELTDFLFCVPYAWSENEILTYWRIFRDSCVAETKQHSPYYFLMRGHEDWNHDDDRWIGIYRTISVLKNEYYRAKDKLEEERSSDDSAWGGSYPDPGERVMIHAFDEVEGKWYFDIKPETLFDEVM